MVSKIKSTLRDDHFYDEYYYDIDKILYLGYEQAANAVLYSLAKQEAKLLKDIGAVVLMAPCAKMNVQRTKTGMTFMRQVE